MKNDDKTQLEQNDQELEIWNEGRRELLVVLEDGTEQIVTIKKCGIGQMPKLQAAQNNDERTALLYIVGKDPDNADDQAWLETLSPDSLMDVLERGDQLNASFLSRWWKRKKKVLKGLGVDIDKEIHQAMDAAKDQLKESDSTTETATRENTSRSVESSATSSREVATASSS